MLVSERGAEHAATTESEARTAADPSLTATSAADLTPTAAWSRRVRRIGGLIQAAFAAFWLATREPGNRRSGGRRADRGVWRRP